MIRGRDGVLHVCARQSEIDWSRVTADPLLQDACAHASIKTRVCPTLDEFESDIHTCFSKIIGDVMSPFLTPSEVVEHSSLPSSALLKSELLAVMKSVSDSCGCSSDDVRMNSMVVSTMKEVAHLWVAELLDKNATEFSFTCPRAWSLYSMESFEAWPDGLVVENRLGVVADPGLDVSLYPNILARLEPGCRIKTCSISELTAGAVVLSGRYHLLSEASGRMLAVGASESLSVSFTLRSPLTHPSIISMPGTQFDWTGKFPFNSVNEWCASMLKIDGLPDHLQPQFLNKQYAVVVTAQKGDREFCVPKIRRLAKQKDPAASRPLGDQSTSPTAVLNTLLGRVIDLVLLTLPRDSHLDVSSPAEIFERMNNWNMLPSDDPNYVWSMFSLDFSNCFMNLPHELIIESWDFLHRITTSLLLSTAWVSPFKAAVRGARSARKFATWKAPPPSQSKRWSAFDLNHVAIAIRAILRDMWVSPGGKPLGGVRAALQRLGVTMGIGAASALCRMVLIVAELRALSSLPFLSLRASFPSWSWGGLRFIDDARLVLHHPKDTQGAFVMELFARWGAMLWPSCLPWKPDAVNPMVGLFVFTSGNRWHWMPEPKSVRVDGVCRSSSKLRPAKSFQDFSSWVPPKVQMGVLTSVWAKCRMQSSSENAFVHSSLVFAWALLRCHRYPLSTIVTSLTEWARKPKNAGGSPRLSSLIHQMSTFLASGVAPPELRFNMSALPSSSYVESFVTFSTIS